MGLFGKENNPSYNRRNTVHGNIFETSQSADKVLVHLARILKVTWGIELKTSHNNN